MKSIIPPSFCLAIALFLSWQPVTAGDGDPFIAKYLAAEKKLLVRYVYNRKVTTHTKTYQLGKDNSPLLLSSFESTTVFGEDAFRTKGRDDYEDPKSQQGVGKLFGGLRVPGDGYSLIQGDKPDSYRIQSQSLPPSDLRDISSMPPAPFVYPLMYGGDDGGPFTIGYVLRHSGQKLQGTRVLRTFLSATPSTWQGQPAIAIKVRSTFGDIVSTTYVDPANDYAALGYESDSSLDATGKKGPVRRMGVLTYAPSAEGVPLPTKYEMWYILPDGRKVPNALVEFLEYSKYTPTADDFDLEKQFGIKPLPPLGTGTGANLTASRRLGWWLYGGAALFALVTAGLMVIVRRRRRAASSAPQ